MEPYSVFNQAHKFLNFEKMCQNQPKGLKNWNYGAQTHTQKTSPPKKESSEPLEDKIYKHIDTIPLELKGKCGRET
jgi:hypothetical protein